LALGNHRQVRKRRGGEDFPTTISRLPSLLLTMHPQNWPFPHLVSSALRNSHIRKSDQQLPGRHISSHVPWRSLPVPFASSVLGGTIH
jgi:hypothetical protein